MTTLANILIVDDNETNRNVLNDLIVILGHTPIQADNGITALKILRKQAIDLVLLDIIMPEMDGHETLDIIKDDKKLCHIPIIVISALDEEDSIIHCIQSGAADYLNKPFNPTFLEARINSCLEKKRFRDKEKVYVHKIENYNANLEQCVLERTQELQLANEKLSLLEQAKSDFLNLISHQFKQPLTGLLNSSDEIFRKDLDDSTREEYNKIFNNSLAKLLIIVKQSLLLTRIEISRESFSTSPNRLQILMKSAIDLSSKFFKLHKVTIKELPDCNPIILSEKLLHIQAFNAILKTAASLSNQNSEIDIICKPTKFNKSVLISIHTQGTTLPDSKIKKIFGMFSVIEPLDLDEKDLAFGPAVAEKIITLFDGSVNLENNITNNGMVFNIKLKLSE
jgi:DNA-binding response OmpR family regulator